MLILGVDPGSQRTGYGVIETDGRRHVLVEKGVLSPPRHEDLAALITRLRPDALSVEDVFHAVNARSALVLGHVRGVVLLAGAEAGLQVHAFTPATVKAQVTGYGRAEKHQVAMMVSRILALESDEEAGDATDALAVALCLAHRITLQAATVPAAHTARVPR
jgi:crossover junction endodeoxyribonuclease RuvC